MSEQHEQQKGGSLARQAAMLCRAPAFCLYLDQRHRQARGLPEEALPDGTHDEHDAADFIRHACGVTTRALLDAPHHGEARAMFGRIVGDFNRWKQKQRRDL